MTQSEKRSEALLGALRDDLPSQRDEARIRRKLATAGIAVGTTVAAANVAQAAAGAKALGALTSTAPAAAAVKNGSLIASTWLGLATSTKAVIVGAAIAGATYPAVSHWAASSSEQPSRPADAPAVTRVASHAAGAVANRAEASGADTTSAPGVASPLNERSLGVVVPNGGALTKSAPRVAAGGGAGALLAGPAAGRPTQAIAQQPPPSAAVAPQPEAVDSRLLEETTLIERALVASRANDKAAAQRWLDEHARRFPAGVLARERERLRTNSM